MTLGMAAEAVKGAVREVWTPKGVPPLRRVAILITLLVIIVRELVGTAMMAGYGTFAFWVYSSLPAWRKEEKAKKAKAKSESNIVVARNVQYGHSRRNLLDVYVPKRRKGLEGPRPVAVFVHGGVWASGDKWQFSPLGSFLAEEGVVAVLVQYTLYPKVLAIDQVSEVSVALTWTMDNIDQYGGDPGRVTLMGHSSGSHLCAMMLWERACGRLENARTVLNADTRIPARYLGLAGVYNIGEHFKYEQKRGIASLSCMRPAMGWEQGFDSMSPHLLFTSLLPPQPGVSFGAEEKTDNLTTQINVSPEMDLMPPSLFITSHKDVTVPPDSSLAFHSLLSTQFGCDTRVVLHEVLSHVDFVIWHEGWGKLKAHVGPYLEDVLNFIRAGHSSPQK